MDEAGTSKNLITTLTFSNTLAKKLNHRSGLYQDDPACIQLNHPTSAKEVIQRVIGDVEKITRADTSSGCKSTKKDLKIKKHTFVPLNVLAPCPMEPKKNKCETQGVTDTQMLDAADGADAVLQMISHKGMTQMFDVSFTKKVNPHENSIVGCEEKYIKNVKEDNYNVLNNVYKGQVKITNQMDCDQIDLTEKELFLKDVDNFEQLSPVLTPSLSAVKTRLPKSIKNKQLKRKLSTEINEPTKELIYKRSKGNEYVISKDIVNGTMQNETHPTEKINSSEKDNILNENIDDEIIFSSDEEFGVQTPKKFLPLTCKIHNNINSDPSNSLDESLYVFFTTASDKSIQVSRNSFEKAKKSLSCILDEDFVNNTKDSFSENEADEVDKGSIKDVAREMVSDDDTNKFSTDYQETPFKSICKKPSHETIQNYDNIYEEKKYIASKILPATKIKQRDVMSTLERMSNPSYDSYHNKGTNNSYNDRLESAISFKNANCGYPQKFSTSNVAEGGIMENSNENKHLFQDIDTIGKKKQNMFESEVFYGFDSIGDESLKYIKETLRKAIKKLCFETKNNSKWAESYNKTLGKTEKFCVSHKKAHDLNEESTEEGIYIVSEKQSNCNADFDGPLITKVVNQQFQLLKKAKHLKNAIEDGVNMVVEDQHKTSFELQRLTPGNKMIRTSKEVLAKSNNLCIGIKDKINTLVKNQPLPTSEFQNRATSMNKVQVSKQASSQPKDIFESINDEILTVVKDHPEPSNFQGFKTASNKQITFSELALAKSKKLFEGIEKEINDLDSLQPGHSIKFQGFATASNKKIKVSKQALSASRNLFEGIDADVHNMVMDQPMPTTKFQGFTTASNKKIKVSEKALAKSKNIFVGIDTEVENNGTDQPEHSIELQEFEIASNKKIKVSEQAFSTCKNLFNGIETEIPTIDMEHLGHSTKFQGFVTANNKQIKVSERALAKSKNIFKGIDTDINDMVTDQSVLSTEFRGFATASNKQIKVSEEALAKSKNMFQDIEHEISITAEKQSSPFAKQQRLTTSINNNIEQYNKEIQVSQQAFVKTNTINDFFDNQQGISTKFKGFTTASNKKIKVKEETLAKTKILFRDEENINEINVLNEETYKRDSLQNIQEIATSSNTIIDLDDLMNEDINIMQKKQNQAIISKSSELRTMRTFQGFTTASNKTIKVTEDALAKTRNIFQEFDDIKFSQLEVAVPKFGGFTTASNKNVEVSKDALDKIKAKFGEQSVEENRGCSTPRPQGFKTANNQHIEAPETLENHLKDDTIIKKSKKDKENMIKERLEHADELLNTQIKNNFEEALCSEDFIPSPKRPCGSPILPCSSAKRRRTNVFKVPYRLDSQMEIPKSKKRKVDSSFDPNKMFCELTENYKITVDQRIKLRDLTRGKEKFKKIEAVKLDFNNLSDFKFDKRRNELTDTELSIKDLTDIFLNSVDRKIVPSGWIQNHIRLILWKLISYENVFPDSLAGVTTAKNVLQQLKYRYERELNKVERPVLRKILEMDEVPSRYMVLCVVRIFADGQEIESVTNTANLEMEVTDGWYCVRAVIDKTLSKAIVDGKLVSGTKIATHGAELLNCGQGIAPWEDISSVRLKLSANSTRLAAWHARLGARASAPPAALRRVTPGGGRVAALRAHVARVYPPLYLERFEDGSTVTRSERLEALHAARHEAERAARLERACEEAEHELTQPADWEEARECPTQVRALAARYSTDTPTNLTDTQVRLLNDYSAKKHDRIMEEMQAKIREKIEKISQEHQPRNVVSLLKVRLCGWHRARRRGADGKDKDGATGRHGNTDDHFEMTKAVLSIWKPSEYLTDVLREGVWIDAMNVVPTAVRMSEVHISAGRQSIFRKSHQNDIENATFPTASVARKCVPIKDLQSTTKSPTFNEVDIVGLIVQIDPAVDEFDKKPTRNQNFQNVYLADSENNLACVNFWGGLKKFGYEKIVERGQFVACLNLQTRMGNTRKSTPQFRVTELSTFTKVPRNKSSSNALEQLKKDFENVDLDAFCMESVRIRSGMSEKIRNHHLEIVTPYRFHDLTEYNLSKHKAFIESPLAQKPVTSIDLNLTGLDFESTFKHETQDTAEEELRKAKVESRMEKLKMYGEPPPLSAIHITNRSFKIVDPFKSPIAEGVMINSGPRSSVGREAIVIPDENDACGNQSSPVLLRNDSVHKSFVNPVKLNFDSPKHSTHSLEPEGTLSCQNDENFSEEFDYSPPLSLDADFL